MRAPTQRFNRHRKEKLDGVLEHWIPELTAACVRQWLARTGVKTLLIESGSSWENGDAKSFNGKLRDECLDGEVFETHVGGPGAGRTLAVRIRQVPAAQRIG
jgi:transposase InsO family protein